MGEYIAYLHKDSGSDFGVTFPDFPGCVTAGRTLTEAREMAASAARFELERRFGGFFPPWAAGVLDDHGRRQSALCSAESICQRSEPLHLCPFGDCIPASGAGGPFPVGNSQVV